MNPLLTPKQVAEILGISTWTVNQLCNRKKLRFVQVDSKNRRFSEEMIQEYIDSQTQQTVDHSHGGQVKKPKETRKIAVSPAQHTEISRAQLMEEMNSF